MVKRQQWRIGILSCKLIVNVVSHSFCNAYIIMLCNHNDYSNYSVYIANQIVGNSSPDSTLNYLLHVIAISHL